MKAREEEVLRKAGKCSEPSDNKIISDENVWDAEEPLLGRGFTAPTALSAEGKAIKAMVWISSLKS